jgi:hypothetical protein
VPAAVFNSILSGPVPVAKQKLSAPNRTRQMTMAVMGNEIFFGIIFSRKEHLSNK